MKTDTWFMLGGDDADFDFTNGLRIGCRHVILSFWHKNKGSPDADETF